MQAVVYDRYGKVDVLALRDVDPPDIGPNEALVRVRTAGLNPKDSFFRKGRFRIVSGRRFPKFTGVDFVGTIERAGPGFASASVGDAVMGFLEEWTYRRGTLAELVRVKSNEVTRISSALFVPETAGVPLAALTALQALRDIARVAPGDRVCISGASGGVGTLAIQIAKVLGARVITTSSPRNFELCRSLGADETLDYAAGDPFTAGRDYRVVFDVFGDLSLSRVRDAMTSHGVYVTTVPSKQVLREALLSPFGYPRARFVLVRARTNDLEYVAKLLEQKRLRPVTDRTFGFTRDEAVAAITHLESKRSRGKILVEVSR